MKLKVNLPGKNAKLEQANSTIMAMIAVASVVTIFSLVSVKALLAQANHQRHVLSARNQAVDQQKKNLQTAQSLSNSFDVFNKNNPNIIGGIADNNSSGPLDGDNARIVLDSLPSQYDFPALISSIDKVLANNNIGSPSVTGTDQSDSLSSDATASPQPVKISLSVSGISNYQAIQNFVKDLERSIRPFDITSLQLTGNESNMQLNMDITTYYQQAKSLDNGSKEVK